MQQPVNFDPSAAVGYGYMGYPSTASAKNMGPYMINQPVYGVQHQPQSINALSTIAAPIPAANTPQAKETRDKKLDAKHEAKPKAMTAQSALGAPKTESSATTGNKPDVNGKVAGAAHPRSEIGTNATAVRPGPTAAGYPASFM
uniref:Uncharacterized protein n=1 Tax=Romanomermis culicivorax TaxID=13658 RepID=A0A915JD07_ROMCU